MATPLLDYSFARPEPSKIVAAGYKGVIRYLAPAADAAKVLSASERDALRAAGLAIGLVWEWYSQRANEGHDAGLQDGQAALALANSLGVPTSVPIFFAVDWDATPEQQANINAYLNGAKTVLGDRVGIYSGYWPLKRAFDANIVSWGWQTYAWSGGQWDNRAQLRQTLNGQWGGQVDVDEDEKALSGLWMANAPISSAPPAPMPQPQTQTFGTHTIRSGETFWGLEAENGWTHGVLENLNPSINPSNLQIGEVIKVPSGTSAPSPAASAGKYAIRSGDTFWGLEAKNSWAHGTLQGLNPGVNAGDLQIGQEINVPGEGEPQAAPATHKYAIKSGDTFWALEATHRWPHGILEQLNPGINPADLQIGEVVNTP